MAHRHRRVADAGAGNVLHNVIVKNDMSAAIGLLFSVEKEGVLLRSPNSNFKDVVNELDGKGRTPIHLALKKGRWRIAGLIFEYMDEMGIQIHSVEKLWKVALGKSSKRRDDDGFFSLAHLCMMFGTGVAMKAVLKKHPESSRWTFGNHSFSPMHQVVYGRIWWYIPLYYEENIGEQKLRGFQLQNVKILLQHDPDVLSIGDKSGQTPIHHACMNDNRELLSVFMKHERNMKFSVGKFPAYHISSNGCPPIFVARDRDTVMLMLNEADDDMPLIKSDGKTLLHCLIETGSGVLNEDILMRLSKQMFIEWRGISPLEYAFKTESSELVISFVEQCKYLSLHEDKCTVQHVGKVKELLGFFSGWGYEQARCRIFHELVKCRDCLSELSLLRGHLIRAASIGGHVNLLRSVFRSIKKSVNEIPDIIGEHVVSHGLAQNGSTNLPTSKPSPLWIACERGKPKYLRHLIENKSVTDERAPDGTTAMAVAIANKSAEITRLLLERQVEPMEDNIFLAKEMLIVDCASRDEETRHMQLSIKEALLSLGIPIVHSGIHFQDTVDSELISNTINFPLINPDSEGNWSVNAEVQHSLNILADKGHLWLDYLGEFVLGDFCLSSDDTWTVANITPLTCAHHSTLEKANCNIVCDLLDFVQTLERLLQTSTPPMENLKPEFTLVGSVAEGTRIGLGNELDITMKFLGWEKCPFMKVGDSAFHLLRSRDRAPEWMVRYFTEQGYFYLSRFMGDLLDGIEKAVVHIFDQGMNPPSLEYITRNRSWICEQCSTERILKDHLVRQCKNCCVLVSQTKMGVCLQFQWSSKSHKEPLYCSIDLVPVFRVEPIRPLNLASIVNIGMLSPGHPREWFDCVKSYIREDKVLMEIFQDEGAEEMVHYVLLKVINCSKDSYFIRPSQLLSEKKFQSPMAKKAYCYIKALKKALSLDISQYLVKKSLMKPVFKSMEEMQQDNFYRFFFKVLSSAEIRPLFEERINFSAWGRLHHKSYISLKTLGH